MVIFSAHPHCREPSMSGVSCCIDMGQAYAGLCSGCRFQHLLLCLQGRAVAQAQAQKQSLITAQESLSVVRSPSARFVAFVKLALSSMRSTHGCRVRRQSVRKPVRIAPCVYFQCIDRLRLFQSSSQRRS